MALSSSFNTYDLFCVSQQKLNDSLISIFRDYQIIEYYLKRIYSYMHKGNPNKNYKNIKDKTLGNVINLLEKLDYSDNSPWLSKGNYSYLKGMAKIRNYYIHKFFINYLDAEYNNDLNERNNLYKQLIKDKDEIEKMRENIVELYKQVSSN